MIILSCQKDQGAEPQSKTHSPPFITSITISPEKPNKESELGLFIQCQASGGDPVTYHYQWIKNEEEIPGENTSTLKNENFRKEDVIRVRVTPSDGKEDGKPFLSKPVKILNSRPIIQEVTIEPKTATARDDLKAYVRSSDADGDPVYYAYQWEKNGVILSEERKEILEKRQFRRADSITVTVTPDDREALGTPKKSEPIIISNSPPIIISSPPTSVEGTTYIYQVKTNDPDDDPVFFALKSAPKGMEIDKNTGLVRWEIPKQERGSHLIEIEVLDNAGGRSFQRYTLTVEYK
jgi:hypothetical protein